MEYATLGVSLVAGLFFAWSLNSIRSAAERSATAAERATMIAEGQSAMLAEIKAALASGRG